MSATHAIWSQPHASEQRHICIVTETYPPEVNGVAMTLAHLVAGLRTQGHAVSVVRPRQQSSDSSSYSGDPRVTVVPACLYPGIRGCMSACQGVDCSKAAGRNTVPMSCMWQRRGRSAGRQYVLPSV